MKYEIKSYKECKGREGIAFSFDLYVQGAHACSVQQEGNGGETRIDWTPSGGLPWQPRGSFLAKLIAKHVATLPAHPMVHGKIDVTTWMSILADEYTMRRRLLALCKKQIVFRTAKDGIQTIRKPYTVEAAAQLRAQCPVEEIFNETFAAERLARGSK